MSQEIQSNLMSTDIQAVDELIRTKLHSDVILIQQVAEYIIYAGGKRLRPRLVLLWMRACMPEADQQQMQVAYSLAAIVEFIHTATLLHDDVVDESVLRRSRATANQVFGNAASVLVGDFIYSRSFQMMVDHSIEVIKVLADTTNLIAQGEVLQLLHRGQSDTTEYLRIIEHKTAQLFESAAVLGAMSAKASMAQIEAARQYGHDLGMTFQIIDDLLDYTGDAKEMGKNIGDDLKEGKLTLPLIYFLKSADDAVKKDIEQVIDAAIKGEAKEIDLARVITLVNNSSALAQTDSLAREYAQKARQSLTLFPPNPFTAVLASLCDQALERRV